MDTATKVLLQGMTKASLKEELDKRNVKYTSRDTKDSLVAQLSAELDVETEATTEQSWETPEADDWDAIEESNESIVKHANDADTKDLVNKDATPEDDKLSKRSYRKLAKGVVIWSRRNRTTKTLIKVVKLDRADWEVQCIDHNESLKTTRRSGAIYNAPLSQKWCNSCKAIVAAKGENLV